MKNKRDFTSDKKGWIEIVEAFVAVLLITGVILILLNKGYIGRTDISEKVYEAQLAILREIETNDTLRADILNAPEPLPVAWEDSGFPANVKNKITERTPNYLSCTGKICDMTQMCTLGEEESQGKDIYSQAVTITSTLETLGYRKLNLFCWTK
jgi:hypothetical protein